MISSPLDIPEEDWTEAVRRAERVRSPATADKTCGAAVKAAAAELGLSTAQIYGLIQKFRRSPVTQSLVVNKPGPQTGLRRLHIEIKQKIEAAIEAVLKTRERPIVKKLRLEISRDYNAAGLRTPSRTAIPWRFTVARCRMRHHTWRPRILPGPCRICSRYRAAGGIGCGVAGGASGYRSRCVVARNPHA